MKLSNSALRDPNTTRRKLTAALVLAAVAPPVALRRVLAQDIAIEVWTGPSTAVSVILTMSF
jgi:hypothetical protein